MSGIQLQSVNPPEGGGIAPYQDGPALQEWSGAAEAPKSSGPKLGRYVSALNRYKWLIGLFVVIGAAGGYAATKFLPPQYQVKSTILLEVAAGTNGNPNAARGPVQGQELLRAAGWIDLMRSFSIADPVVMQLALFVEPAKVADSTVFRAFRVDQQRLRPGDYILSLTGNRYTLATKAARVEVERGALGDSIGREVGFLWQPSPAAFSGRREIEFRVATPREASSQLIKNMNILLNPGSSLMFVTLNGESSPRAAATLNAWVEAFVTKATALKKKTVMSYAVILEGQRQYAADNLTSAEGALQRFRVQTATEPNERQLVMPGIDMTTNPVFTDYFNNKMQADAYARDRVAIERLLERAKTDGIRQEAVLSIPMVSVDPASGPLRKLLDEQTDRENKLRVLQESFTDEFDQVKNQKATLKALQTETVPRALAAYLAELKLREAQLNTNLAASSKDLRGIPARTIQEAQLKRQVEVAAEMYRSLDLKAAEAKLAEAATIPDVSVLDSAVAPLDPTKNTAPVIILGGILVALIIGALLAVVLDQLDKRFRYPEQATDDLGLFVLGVVPQIDAKAGRKRGEEQAAQVVEAFRSIRMNVRYAADPSRPLTLTITSPGPNDGKSLISCNLALSFAEAGARTLLIDGDLRRGELAKTFGVPKMPGLVEYLDGTALIAEVLHPVQSNPNLTVIQGGARRRRAPELLATPRLTQLINQMAGEFDVVIVDSPPLGAGFDAFALSTATGNMALVLRAGMTDRKMAAAKMAVLDTLPVRVMGSILNGIKLDGVYQYYSYYQGYAADEDSADVRISAGEQGNVPAVVSRG